MSNRYDEMSPLQRALSGPMTLKEFMVFVVAFFVAPFVIAFAISLIPESTATRYDSATGLPVLGTMLKSEPLPDGYYTVNRVGDYCAAVVIQHKPGPNRNFVYYVLHRDLNESVPDDVVEGDRFYVYQGKFVHPWRT